MDRIGKYQIIDKIGAGGMATVFLVRDDLTGMEMAMKLLHDHFAEDDHICKRFLQEARLQLDLNHPNIVRCFNVERVNNRYFILLEYIPGPPLSQVIKQRGEGLKIEEIIPIFTQILSGMEYAHQKGVIHRDIKPMNILLSEYSGYIKGNEIAKISDFGIAKALDKEGHTRTGAQLGSPYFMSPEQIQNAADVDHRTDIYSLGVLLYQLATGKLPYHPTNNPIKLMEEIVKEPIIDPRIYNKDMPNWLVDIIFSATNKNPEDRIQTCAQFSNIIYSNLSKQGANKRQPYFTKTTPRIHLRSSDFEESQRVTLNTFGDSNNKQSSWLPWVLGIIVVSVFFISLALWQLFSTESLKGYTGRPINEVRQELLNNGYEIKTESVYREDIPAGQVFNLDFTNDSKTTVRLWVSKGPRHIYLPNFIGQKTEQAIKYLIEHGLKVKLKKIYSNTYKSGVVLKSIPSKNSLCRNGEEIILIISYNPKSKLKDELKFSKNAVMYLKNNKFLISNTLLENTFSGNNPFISLQKNIINTNVENGILVINKKITKNFISYYLPLNFNNEIFNIICRIDFLSNNILSNKIKSGVSIKFNNNYLIYIFFNTLDRKLILAQVKENKIIKKINYPLKFSFINNSNNLIIELIIYKNEILFFVNGKKQIETKLSNLGKLIKIGFLLPEEQSSIKIDNILIDELI